MHDSRAKRNEGLCKKVVFMWAIRNAGSRTNRCLLVYGLTIILLEYIRWIEDILVPAIVGIPTSIEVAVKIYVTKSEKDPENLENYESKTNESFVEELGPTDSPSTQPISRAVDSPYVSFESGQPDLQGIIQHEIEKASGRMSINGKPKLKFVGWNFSSPRFSPACGPHGLRDTVRKAVRTPRLMDILRGGPTVTLHIEIFGSVSIYIWNRNSININLLFPTYSEYRG